jgi:hypothetical protein
LPIAQAAQDNRAELESWPNLFLGLNRWLAFTVDA